MALECVATVLVAVKTTTEFLQTEAFRRLFEASLCACLGQPGGLLRDGLRVLLAILDEFGGGGRHAAIPQEVLTKMGRFLMQAARWAGSGSSSLPPSTEDAEAVRQQILRLLARLPARAILSQRRRDGEDHVAVSAAAATTVATPDKLSARESEELVVLQRIFETEYDTDSITAAEVRDFLTYLSGGGRNDDGSGGDGSCMITYGGGEVEELEAAFPAVQAASLRAAWLSWTTAGYVVYNKLRSPLGKAQETLGHVDQACRRMAAAGATGGATVPLERGRQLVQFVAHLEKAMINAWDGCSAGSGAPPPAHKSAALFFYANKKTCQDWLERIRGSVMRLAYMVGSYAEVVRHAWSLLLAAAKKEELGSPSNLYLGENIPPPLRKVSPRFPLYCSVYAYPLTIFSCKIPNFPPFR
jgi:hypothetical protein